MQSPLEGGTAMPSKVNRQADKSRLAVTRRTFTAGVGAAGLLAAPAAFPIGRGAGVGAAGLLAASAPFHIGRAQGAALKVGVLLPRSGVQAGIGQDCQRGVEI